MGRRVVAGVCLAGLACLGALPALAQPGVPSVIEFYFSVSNSLSGVPSEYTKNVNPIVYVDQPAYLWAAVIKGNVWNGVNLGFDRDVTGGLMYNPSWGSPIRLRWETSSDFDPVPDDLVNLVAVVRSGLGGDLNDPLLYYGKSAATDNIHFLVGHVSFRTVGEVFMKAVGGGITRKDGSTRERVIFGRGEDQIIHTDPKNLLPDLYVIAQPVPEPAGVLLLSLALVALRRR